MEEYVIKKDEIDETAKRFIDFLLQRVVCQKSLNATVVGLKGDLGAGKTTFVQSVARVLGVSETVPSPTFVIARFYPIVQNSAFTRLVHVDAYRIESEDELRPLGWSTILSDPKNLVFVEWPEKLLSQYPSFAQTLVFHTVDETTRRITIR